MKQYYDLIDENRIESIFVIQNYHDWVESRRMMHVGWTSDEHI